MASAAPCVGVLRVVRSGWVVRPLIDLPHDRALLVSRGLENVGLGTPVAFPPGCSWDLHLVVGRDGRPLVTVHEAAAALAACSPPDRRGH